MSGVNSPCYRYPGRVHLGSTCECFTGGPAPEHSSTAGDDALDLIASLAYGKRNPREALAAIRQVLWRIGRTPFP